MHSLFVVNVFEQNNDYLVFQIKYALIQEKFAFNMVNTVAQILYNCHGFRLHVKVICELMN